MLALMNLVGSAGGGPAEAKMEIGRRSMHGTRSVAVPILLACLLWAGIAEAGANCTPDSGFEWCYQESAWSPAFCKIQVDTNYNTAWVNGYNVAPKNYIVRFSCSGTTYYGPGAWSCSSGGCSAENIGGGVTTKSVAGYYTSNAQVQRVSCHDNKSGWWCYAGYDSWSTGAHVVECYNNSHCGACQSCSTSGAPSNWKCVTNSEVCDGVDNDCDGSTDEGFNVGAPCTVGVGQCTNSGAYVCKSDKTGTRCSVDPLPPTAEKCDGLDNDCDAAADEGFSLGAQCSVGVGECVSSGVYVCKPDGSGNKCSVDPLPSSPETCDAKDNDCDAAVDETWPELTTACSVGVGECTNAGVFVCKADKSGTRCSVEPLAPVAEKCDAKDNDCDAASDEDWPELTTACSVGIGECTNAGVFVCKADKSGTRCSVEPLAPVAEKCDSKDNDCDAASDEDWPELLEPCIVGIGECTNKGVFVCKADTSGSKCSVDPFAPTVEKCDAKDNDCDGAKDQPFDLGFACVSGIGKCAASGERVCLDDGSGTHCSSVAGAPVEESCDGQDNDCDGATDEDWPLLGGPCLVGVGECRQESEWTCSVSGKGYDCPVEALPESVETCDGLDNDCDGVVDNGFAASDPCMVDAGSAAIGHAPTGDLDQDGQVTAVDLQCLVLIFKGAVLGKNAGSDLCTDDWDCKDEVGPGWKCLLGPKAVFSCYPPCLHGLVSLMVSQDVTCDDPKANTPQCLGKVQKRIADMNCDGDLTAVDFNFLVAALLEKLGGAGSADVDADGQINDCDPDNDGDGLPNGLDCSPLEAGVSGCDDSNPCTVDQCGPGLTCLHESAGTCSPDPFLVGVSLPKGAGVRPVAATLADGTATVAWLAAGDTGGAQLFVRGYDDTASAAYDPTQVSAAVAGAEGTALAALSDGRFVTAWAEPGEIRARLVAGSGAPSGDSFQVSVNAVLVPLEPAAAGLADGSFLIAWTAGTQAGNRLVFLQRFTADGGKLDEETALAFAAGEQAEPALAALPGGGFVGVFTGAAPQDEDSGVFCRVFGASGAALGSALLVNEATAGLQHSPAVAALADGRFVVAWESDPGDGGPTLVLMRRFDADGAASDGEAFVSEDFSLDQGAPAVGSTGSGGFAVAWHAGNLSIFPGFGIYARAFDAMGAPFGPETTLTDDFVEEPSLPAVAAFPHGGFIVFWYSAFPATGEPAMYGKLMSADAGAP